MEDGRPSASASSGLNTSGGNAAVSGTSGSRLVDPSRMSRMELMELVKNMASKIKEKNERIKSTEELLDMLCQQQTNGTPGPTEGTRKTPPRGGKSAHARVPATPHDTHASKASEDEGRQETNDAPMAPSMADKEAAEEKRDDEEAPPLSSAPTPFSILSSPKWSTSHRSSVLPPAPPPPPPTTASTSSFSCPSSPPPALLSTSPSLLGVSFPHRLHQRVHSQPTALPLSASASSSTVFSAADAEEKLLSCVTQISLLEEALERSEKGRQRRDKDVEELEDLVLFWKQEAILSRGVIHVLGQRLERALQHDDVAPQKVEQDACILHKEEASAFASPSSPPSLPPLFRADDTGEEEAIEEREEEEEGRWRKWRLSQDRIPTEVDVAPHGVHSSEDGIPERSSTTTEGPPPSSSSLDVSPVAMAPPPLTTTTTTVVSRMRAAEDEEEKRHGGGEARLPPERTPKASEADASRGPEAPLPVPPSPRHTAAVSRSPSPSPASCCPPFSALSQTAAAHQTEPPPHAPSNPEEGRADGVRETRQGETAREEDPLLPMAAGGDPNAPPSFSHPSPSRVSSSSLSTSSSSLATCFPLYSLSPPQESERRCSAGMEFECRTSPRRSARGRSEDEAGESPHPPPSRHALDGNANEAERKRAISEEEEEEDVLVAIEPGSIPPIPTTTPTVAAATPLVDEKTDQTGTNGLMDGEEDPSVLSRTRPRSASHAPPFFASTDAALSSSSSPPVLVSSPVVSRGKSEEEIKNEAEEEEEVDELQIRLHLEKSVQLPTVVDVPHLVSFTREVQQQFNDILHFCSGVQKRNKELTYQVKALIQFKEAVMRELKG